MYADYLFIVQEYKIVPAINLFAMALSLLAALFGIAVATSSKRNPEPEENSSTGEILIDGVYMIWYW